MSVYRLTPQFTKHLYMYMKMPTTTRKKAKVVTDKDDISLKAIKSDMFCVLESEDGARIMTTMDANDFMSNSTSNDFKIHFAGERGSAEIMQKDIEARLAMKSKSFVSDALDGMIKKNSLCRFLTM